MKTDTKRQNFNITPEQEAEIAALQQALGASTVKDAILRAVKIVNALRRELRDGRSLYVGQSQSNGEATTLRQILLPDIDSSDNGAYKYLVARPHPWRRQLSIKGRRCLASNIHISMRVNGQTPEQTAHDWDLPLEAIEEIIRYCEANEALITAECQEEAVRSDSRLYTQPPAPSERAA